MLPGGTITLASYQHSFRYTDASDAKHTEVEALAVGLQQCGSFVGCVAIFPITSRWGRRIAMQLSALIFVLGAAVQTANTHHLSSFYIGRIVAGLGVGGASVIVPLYASEMSPAHLRGRIGSGYQFLFTWGIFCSYWFVSSLMALCEQLRVVESSVLVPTASRYTPLLT